MAEIARAQRPEDYAAARLLLDEYARLRGVQACFEREERHHREMDELGALYGPPHGAMLLAREGAEAVGCVALRDLGGNVCEMRRLYVRPAHRGRGIGRRLAEAIAEEGRRLGYGLMRLDSLDWMREAQALYRSMGFRDIPPYHDRGGPGEVSMELALEAIPAAGRAGTAGPGPGPAG